MKDGELRALLAQVAEAAAEYRERLGSRSVRETLSTDALRRTLGGGLPADGVSADRVIAALSEAAKEGTVASAGPRYFGFVTGGSTPAALAADWLVSAWDQNTSLHVMSPLVSVVEEVTAAWLCELLAL